MYYDGPSIVNWLEDRFGSIAANHGGGGALGRWMGLSNSQIRRLNYWRHGALAKEDTLERLLNHLGYDIWEVPSSVKRRNKLPFKKRNRV